MKRKILKWYYKHGAAFEEYTVLWENEKYILVQNCDTKKYTFGLRRDFGTLYGFPVGQSCLTLRECKEVLAAFIDIDKKYSDCNQTMSIWENMLDTL